MANLEMSKGIDEKGVKGKIHQQKLSYYYVHVVVFLFTLLVPYFWHYFRSRQRANIKRTIVSFQNLKFPIKCPFSLDSSCKFISAPFISNLDILIQR
jgi:hypothetical protein